MTALMKCLAIIMIVVTAIVTWTSAMAADAADPPIVLLEDTVYIDTDSGGTTHAMCVLIPLDKSALQLDYCPDVDGLDIGFRLPEVNWGEHYKLQPRVIGQFQGKQGLDGVKFQAMVTGEKGWWLTGVRFADDRKTSHFNQIQWDAAGGEDVTASIVAVVAGDFGSHERIGVNFGPALTWHIPDGIGDVQFYYGAGINANTADTAWLQFDFYIPTN